jgi:hypothetical protein
VVYEEYVCRCLTMVALLKRALSASRRSKPNRQGQGAGQSAKQKARWRHSNERKQTTLSVHKIPLAIPQLAQCKRPPL